MANFDLIINASKVKQRIVDKLIETLRKRENTGFLVIFSGQNDSFVSAKLAIEAIGLEAVKLIIISDVPKIRRDEISSIAIEKLEVPNDHIISFDIKNIAKNFESVEKLISEGISGFPVIYHHGISYELLKSSLVQKIIEDKTYSNIGKDLDKRDVFFRELIAFSKVRKRLKTLLAYFIAERENLLLVSKTNKTEYMTGLYTIFGYGHAADIMPLGDLFRTQVLQLSKYINVPQEIRDFAHTDIVPGIVNKYQYFFDLKSYDVDKILIRLDAGMETKAIIKELNIPQEKVDRVKHFYNVSKFQETLPIIPYIDG